MLFTLKKVIGNMLLPLPLMLLIIGAGLALLWSKLFIERYGFTNATEVAMACATFGLVLGGLIGGPVARYLVKHSTTPNGIPDDQEVPTAFEKPDDVWSILTVRFC